MNAYIEKLIPGPLRRIVQERNESRALSALSRTACNVTNLRSEVPNLGSFDLTDEWQSVQETLVRLKIGDKAGAVNPGDRRAIYYLARALRATTVLEVGTHLGASTSMFGLALLHTGAPSPKIVTVDILDVNGPDGAWARLNSKAPKTVLSELECDFVEFITSPSVPFLRSCKAKFDLIFLDGGHEATTVYQEVPAALELLNPGGLILLHDFYPGARPLWSDGAVVAGPWLAIERFKSEGAKVSAQPLGNLPWPTKLGSNVTSLACLIST